MNTNLPPLYNRDTEVFGLFRNYMHFCSEEQITLNNMLHTQNLLSNNRYSMFNQMFHFFNPETNSIFPPPTFSFPNQSSQPTGPTIPPRRERQNRRSQRGWRNFPSHNLFTRRNAVFEHTVTNPLNEFITAANNDTSDRRRPTTMRQFFDNCEVFIYNPDLSNNQIRCPISMTDFSNNNLCVKLPCHHIFKLRPLLQWLSTARTCPMCRQRINSLTRHDSSNNVINLTNNNVSVQTTDINNGTGFITDVSANNLRDLSTALTQTLTDRIENMFQNLDLSNNNIPLGLMTNISLVAPHRNIAQSPINDIFVTRDASGNIDSITPSA
jgi:hypothetical protein